MKLLSSFLFLAAQMPVLEQVPKSHVFPYLLGAIGTFATIILRKKLQKAMKNINEVGFFGKIYLWIIVIFALLAVYFFTLKTVWSIILGVLLGLIALALIFFGIILKTNKE